jgi:hypothetical protein
MAQTQKTIRFNKESDRLIAEVSPSGDVNFNYSVNQIIHRYSILCDHLTPDFTEKEWMAIYQAYNGRMFNADIELEAKAFMWCIKESIQYDINVNEILGDHMNTDWPEFIGKCEALTIPQIIAVFQKVHEFWAQVNVAI